NAVLRRAAREGRALVESLDDATPQAAALKHSHPEWVTRLWWEALGPSEARALMAADNRPPESALRANTLVTDAELVAAELATSMVATSTACWWTRPARDWGRSARGRIFAGAQAPRRCRGWRVCRARSSRRRPGPCAPAGCWSTPPARSRPRRTSSRWSGSSP